MEDHSKELSKGEDELIDTSPKLQFRSLIAAEVNNDHDQILGKRLLTNSSNNSSVEENASENIWHEWQKFLDDPLRRNLYEPLNPEKNNVIWCGKSVARRSSLPEDPYARLQVEVESVPAVAINHDLHEIVDRVLDADDLEQYEDAIEELRIQKNQLKENKLQINFLTGILERLKNIYEDDEDKIEHSEPCLNYDLTLPCLKVSVQMIRKNGYKVTTFPGEEELEAMKKQQQSQRLTDNRHKYKAGGIVRYDSNNEILFMETSAAYNNAPSEKCSFDHYKAMFGLLAMIKTLSDKYQYASFEVLKKLKLHFIHVHGTAVRWWTMSIPEKDIYVMCKERRAEIPKTFSKKRRGTFSIFITLS
ncbi:hypothetical protein G6F37_000614 [Rhizopus arrhizus]|nr:hypothetical protein G6F38_002283 [Rhizopus arrhizus]KAG1164087.1 hypothetical protein G6F37_000614 [Rhizopus arrhizus]